MKKPIIVFSQFVSSCHTQEKDKCLKVLDHWLHQDYIYNMVFMINVVGVKHTLLAQKDYQT